MVRNIQVLRCLAALAVVLHHLQLRLHDDVGGPVFSFAGRAGVDVFFVVSGFIMFHTTRNNDRTVFQFWTDRAIRIAPMYWLVTWLVVGLFLLNLHPIDLEAISAKDLLADMMFLPNYRADGDAYPILDVGWTLNYEIYFYALFGLTFFLRSQVAALGVLSAWFVGTSLIGAFGPPLPHFLDFYFEPLTLEFAAGGALALLYRRDIPMPAAAGKYLGAAVTVLGFFLVGATSVAWGEYVNWDPALRTLAFGIPAVLIVAGALMLERSGVSIRNPMLLMLGAASFSIYLIHQLALQYVLVPLEQVFPAPGPIGLVLLALAGFTAAVLAGVALHVWIEKPLTGYLHKLARRKRETPPELPVIGPVAAKGAPGPV
jgi:peptidoglycan/LPS O-acetylase OafA/YrhL